MANPNPVRARRARRRKRVAAYGDLDDVRATLWRAVQTAADALGDADVAVRLKATHAVNQAAAGYLKAVEACEFEGRLSAVEREVGLGS